MRWDTFPKVTCQENLSDQYFVNLSSSYQWSRFCENFTHEVSVPANASAVVYIPCKSPETVTEVSGYAEYTGMADGYAVYKVPSGKYIFNSEL